MFGKGKPPRGVESSWSWSRCILVFAVLANPVFGQESPETNQDRTKSSEKLAQEEKARKEWEDRVRREVREAREELNGEFRHSALGITAERSSVDGVKTDGLRFSVNVVDTPDEKNNSYLNVHAYVSFENRSAKVGSRPLKGTKIQGNSVNQGEEISNAYVEAGVDAEAMMLDALPGPFALGLKSDFSINQKLTGDRSSSGDVLPVDESYLASLVQIKPAIALLSDDDGYLTVGGCLESDATLSGGDLDVALDFGVSLDWLICTERDSMGDGQAFSTGEIQYMAQDERVSTDLGTRILLPELDGAGVGWGVGFDIDPNEGEVRNPSVNVGAFISI